MTQAELIGLEKAHRNSGSVTARLIEHIRELEQEMAVVLAVRQHGCDCSDADACQFVRERDAARATVVELRTQLGGTAKDVT